MGRIVCLKRDVGVDIIREFMSGLAVHSALLIVNIPTMIMTRLTIIHKGPTISSLFDTCSALKTAKKAKNTKDATANKPDSHLGKRLVLRYPIPLMNIPRYITDHCVLPHTALKL